MQELINEFKNGNMWNLPELKIEDIVLDLDLEIYNPISDDVETKKISDYKGKWLVLFFYPADFTFVCPTELKDLWKAYSQIKELENVELLVASTDSVFSHKGRLETEKLLEGFEIPMVADRTTLLSRYFGILNENTWNSERWTFIISPDWVLKTVEVHTEPLGRSSAELVRKLKGLKFVTENPGQACPASWNNDMPTLKPSIKIAGHVWENM